MKYCVLLLFICLVSCVSEKEYKAPDVSHIDLNYSNIRVDQMLFEDKSVADILANMEKKHPAFFNLYFKQILPIFNENNDSFNLNVSAFVKDSSIYSIYQAVQSEYPEKKLLEKEIDIAFKILKYFLPQIMVPDVYSFISEFGYQQFVFADEQGRNAVGLGLDMFLRDYPYKAIEVDNPAFSDYLTRTYNREHIVSKLIQLIVSDYSYDAQQNTFLEHMIYNGKLLYVSKKVLGDRPDYILFEYTPTQMDWVVNNEKEIWSYFLGEDMFYKTDLKIFNKYINPSPNSPGMPESAPGRTGNYIGYKIVEAYMNQNAAVSIVELLKDANAQVILEKSKYKPRR